MQNEPRQSLTLNAWVEEVILNVILTSNYDVIQSKNVSFVLQTWHDRMLYWDPAEFGNTSQVQVPHDSIWMPDTVLYNKFVVLI